MKKPDKSFRNLVLMLVIPIAIYSVFTFFGQSNDGRDVMTVSGFIKKIEAGEVESVRMTSERLVAKMKEDKKAVVYFPMFYSVRLIDDLLKKDVEVDFSQSGQSSKGMKFLLIIGQILSWLPLILMGWIAYSFLRSAQNNGQDGKKSSGGGLFGSNPFGFGKSKAKAIEGKNLKVSFDDVAGVDEAKKDLAEIVDFLADPARYNKIGGIIPKGCLLVGYPGTGKTLLAKAIAFEAKVPFFFMSGSDFVEMFVGVGASRVRDLFAQAKRFCPCIIFIDEIDAVGRSRGVGIGGGNDEREQTLNQLLVEMDGFEENSGVIVIAATNRPDVLDPALLRPGRFDRQITISLPDIKGREKIMEVHMKKIKTTPLIDVSSIVRGTPGFSGADLANLVNEAALLATRERKEVVTLEDFENAKDKILMGSARATIIKRSEKELTAYHEGGHALVAMHLEASDPVHKVTIIPRGQALGLVVRLPKDDTFSVTLEKMKADIAVGLAGRVAEEMIFGKNKITSGASSDIKQTTQMARSMVVKWGLSEKVGMINYSEDKGSFLSKNNPVEYKCSESIASLIDDEVKNIIDEGYRKAREILSDRKDDLDLIAKNLLDVETISGEDLAILLKDKKLPSHVKKRATKSRFEGIISRSEDLSEEKADDEDGKEKN